MFVTSNLPDGWLKKFDEFSASFARPYQQYACASALAFGLVWAVMNKADATVIVALSAPCAGIAGGSAYLRSVDKKTAATVEISKDKPVDTTVDASIK